MKSRTSFFNGGVARNLLRRFWPLWAAYFAALLLILPGQLSRYSMDNPWLRADLDCSVVQTGLTLALAHFAVGPLAAMAMFHYLYQTRSCGMMNALPLRRETMFSTAFLTGLAPLLLSQLLAALLTAAAFCTRGYLHLSTLLDWLALAMLSIIAFYGFAVFCAMLTGSLLVLPLVYAVLSFTAGVAELCVRDMLSVFVYGMPPRGLRLLFLSPPAKLYRALSYELVYEWRGGQYTTVPGAYQLKGLELLAIYAALGLVLAFLALLLYRRRRMETATDVVAVPVLKPVFQYCLSFGTAVVFADLMHNWLFKKTATGTAEAGLMLLLMLIGAALGFYAAEMLMQKTLRVFPGKWKGLAAVCAALCLLTALCEFDAFGYERRVPAAETVESARLYGFNSRFRQPESVEAVLAFHRELIEDRSETERLKNGRVLTIHYDLTDGGTMDRQYYLPFGEDATSSPVLARLEALCNLPEPLLTRLTPTIPVVPENVRYAEIGFPSLTDAGHWRYDNFDLTAAEACELYELGILPDARAGRIGHTYLQDSSEYYDKTLGCSISINLLDRERGDRSAWESFYVNVELDSEATLRWLREHLGDELELLTLRELEMDAGIG